LSWLKLLIIRYCCI